MYIEQSRTFVILRTLGFVAVALASMTGSSSAQTCLLPPVVLPGLSGPPIWKAGSGTPVRTDLTDPRWAGAPLMHFDRDGTGTEAAYRAMLSGSELNISFQVLADANGTDTRDVVYLGITSSNDAAANAYVFRIAPERTGSTDPIDLDPGANYQGWTKSGAGTWTSFDTKPNWLKDVATWRNNPVGAVWAVNLKVRLNDIGVNGSFRLFLATGVSHNGWPDVIFYNQPTYPSETPVIGETVPADPSLWTLISPPGTPCTAGVSVSPLDIGTRNTPESVIKNNGANTFFAKIRNIPEPVYANKVLARFSIADWGSQIADPNAPWNIIEETKNFIPDGANGIWTSGPEAGTATIEFTCAVKPGDAYCPKLKTVGASTHQCMLVELKRPFSQNYSFAKSAVYRNMDFRMLSTLTEESTIQFQPSAPVALPRVTKPGLVSPSARGGVVPTIATRGPRDMYIYVQTKNMPSAGATPMRLSKTDLVTAKTYAEKSMLEREPIDLKVLPKDRLGRPMYMQQRLRVPTDAVVRNAVPVLSAHQALARVWPTYINHAYVDTGRTVTIQGTTVRILEPMVPHGYYLDHDGDLYGYTSELRATGNQKLEKIAANYYRIPGATAARTPFKLSTRITAEEKPVTGQVPVAPVVRPGTPTVPSPLGPKGPKGPKIPDPARPVEQ